MTIGNPDSPEAQVLALTYSAQQKLMLAARDEYRDVFGVMPTHRPEPIDEIPNGYESIGTFANTSIIKRVDDPTDDTTTVWPWPYFDPEWAGGMVLSELRAMFPFMSI